MELVSIRSCGRKGLNLICHNVYEVVNVDSFEKYSFYKYLFED